MNRYFDCCLYFTANELAREMEKMAERAFKNMDITPVQGFTLLLIADKGMESPSEIAKEMGMNPSSITRFVDALVKKGYIERLREGRTVTLVLTASGKACKEELNTCWNAIHDEYAPLLGEDFSKQLNKDIVHANQVIKEREVDK